jgi:CheY-like chemotaxis protein
MMVNPFTKPTCPAQDTEDRMDGSIGLADRDEGALALCTWSPMGTAGNGFSHGFDGHEPHLQSDPSARLAGSPTPLRILLVEDHADTLRVMSRLLRNFGYHVTSAATATEALRLAEAEEFDLLISDIGLPDGNGWEVMRKIRSQQAIRGIALSGYGMDEDLQRSQEAGFEQHLIKPVNFQVLDRIIRRITA